MVKEASFSEWLYLSHLYYLLRKLSRKGHFRKMLKNKFQVASCDNTTIVMDNPRMNKPEDMRPEPGIIKQSLQ